MDGLGVSILFRHLVAEKVLLRLNAHRYLEHSQYRPCLHNHSRTPCSSQSVCFHLSKFTAPFCKSDHGLRYCLHSMHWCSSHRARVGFKMSGSCTHPRPSVLQAFWSPSAAAEPRQPRQGDLLRLLGSGRHMRAINRLPSFGYRTRRTALR